MRIALPDQIPLTWTAVFAAVLMAVQIWQGTNAHFAELHFVFLILWIFTFNLAGGFRRISGAYVFWFGLLTVPVGTLIKAFINDPADSNCWAPVLTMLMYTVGMALLCGAVFAVRQITVGRRSVAEALTAMRPLRYREAAVGLFALGIALQFGFYFLPLGLYRTVHLMDQTMPLAIILGTIQVIYSSGYRRTLGAVNVVPMLYSFYMALAGFSKLALFLPWVAWLLAVAYTRFRLRLPQMAGIVLVGWYCVYALTPMAQVGRNVVTEGDYNQRAIAAIHLLVNIQETRREYEQAGEDSFVSTQEYFSKDVNSFWQRMTIFAPDDRLISYTSHGNHVGWAGVRWSFLNLIPHFLLPNKDQYAVETSTGNYYGREIGMINPLDTTTGISFSPVAEAFHIGGWFAVLVFLPLLWILFLTALEFVCGDLRATPWGLVIALYLAHVAPESGVDGLISFITVGNIGMIFTIVLSSFVAPVIGNLFVRDETSPQAGVLTAAA